MPLGTSVTLRTNYSLCLNKIQSVIPIDAFDRLKSVVLHFTGSLEVVNKPV